ncbi:restriction endonuclease subunit S [Faecalibacterium prausnitzii]|uniref:restriction endonuclease subunit S n=1 Tax=Faecalibacterium prausnitzii TaxID=853 RepID=UPI001F2114F4|nr:restriction endonuclease subunit S [Faecalibacterium prausnitzii]
MRKMKDSGVAWIGEIPLEYQTVSIGSLFSIKKDIIGHEPETVLSITQTGIKPKNLASNEGQIANSYSHYQIVNVGDFAMNHMDLLTGWVDISKFDGVTSPDYRVFTLNDKRMSAEYFLRVFQNYYYNRIFFGFGQGVATLGRWRLPTANFKKIIVPIPPLPEQDKIVSAIESSTSKVDALISNVQAQIEKLKAYKQSLITEVVTKGLDPNVPMMDSGVEWIGKIPKHWNMIRFRFIAKITTGNQDTQNADPDGMYPFYVRSPNVEHCNNYTFEGKGILMAGDGAGAGRVFHLVNGKYAVHQRVYRFYDFKYMNPVLLKFYLENLFATVMDYGSAKTTVPSVRLPMIQDFPVCVPPEDEQLKMLEVLSEKTNKIDRFIAVKQTKIEKLEQYKRSLIYEYVTGKKEVS